jgi:prolipoprotein diacylglyceryltransferase/Fe-S-cluster containining protein
METMGATNEELVRGLIYGHNRANANTREVHQANATALALAQILIDRGLIEHTSFEAKRKETADQLQRAYVERGMAVAMQEFNVSKYAFEDGAEVDCDDRLSLCKAACCRLPFALSKEDVQEGVVRWNLGQPYMIAHGETGYCVHCEQHSGRCSIYEHRPIVCRGYDCRKDKRIWLDFDKRIINPQLDDPDWPACLDSNGKDDDSSGQAHSEGEGTDQHASAGVEPSHAASSETAAVTGHPPPAFQRATLPKSPVSLSAQHAIAEQRRKRNRIAIGDDQSADTASRFGARLRARVSEILERLVRPELRLFGRTWPAYGVFVHLGVSLGIALAVSLIMLQGLSIAMMAGIAAAGVLGSVLFALATKVLIGEERFTFYHYQILVTLIAGAALWLLDQPVLPYLDSTLLAMGLILAIGRIGCLMAGCCHGRPHRWGVCYSHAHAAAGFAPELVGVKLIPIQAIESLWLLATVAAASALIVMGRPPGEPLFLYVMAYGAGRFVFEFARGDAARPYALGFSEAQWTSTLLMGSAIAAGTAGLLPLQLWHIAAFAVVLVTVAGFATIRCFGRKAHHKLLHPKHISEVAEVLGQLDHAMGLDRSQLVVGTTSQGIRIAAGQQDNTVQHYSLSCEGARLSDMAAATLAKLILRLRNNGVSPELFRGEHGVFHLLLHPNAPNKNVEGT